MHAPRRLTAIAGAVALAATGVVASSTAVRADPNPYAAPTNLGAKGLNSGYGIGWESLEHPFPKNYTVNLYRTSDASFAAPLATEVFGPTDFLSDPDASAFRHRFDGLTPGVSYRATIRVEYNDGGISDTVLFPARTAFARIAPVTDLRTKSGYKQITVRWTPPRANALTGPLRGYRVQAWRHGLPYPGQWGTWGAAISSPGPSATSVVLRGSKTEPLMNGKLYHVEVTPLAGDEGWSRPISHYPTWGNERRVWATPLAKPHPPTKLKRSWRGGGKTKLTWTRPKATEASPVDGYRVYVNGKRVKTLVGRNATTCIVKGQKSGRTYKFTIRAYNKADLSKKLSMRTRRP